ncbi:short-chain dehydrogenase/reductase SDR [Streptomyces azureus]|uniref:Short-chain dehydrogenase/reductase SDR n=1 Tax=Streptomyces azureus TaxID=146537 RepID=A0A0K8PIA1_STRAJ|nr:short-chain dehydrogenase/reductase SDR [Streptomyces azureus]
MPYTSTASGISATDGMGRRNSIVEAVAARRYGTTEISTPATIPAQDAIARPSAQPVSVSPSAVQKAKSAISSASASAMRLVGGK